MQLKIANIQGNRYIATESTVSCSFLECSLAISLPICLLNLADSIWNRWKYFLLSTKYYFNLLLLSRRQERTALVLLLFLSSATISDQTSLSITSRDHVMTTMVTHCSSVTMVTMTMIKRSIHVFAMIKLLQPKIRLVIDLVFFFLRNSGL